MKLYSLAFSIFNILVHVTADNQSEVRASLEKLETQNRALSKDEPSVVGSIRGGVKKERKLHYSKGSSSSSSKGYSKGYSKGSSSSSSKGYSKGYSKGSSSSSSKGYSKGYSKGSSSSSSKGYSKGSSSSSSKGYSKGYSKGSSSSSSKGYSKGSSKGSSSKGSYFSKGAFYGGVDNPRSKGSSSSS